MSDSATWYYRVMGEEFGPFTTKQMQVLAVKGTVNEETHVRESDQGAWQTAISQPILFEAPSDALEIIEDERLRVAKQRRARIRRTRKRIATAVGLVVLGFVSWFVYDRVFPYRSPSALFREACRARRGQDRERFYGCLTTTSLQEHAARQIANVKFGYFGDFDAVELAGINTVLDGYQITTIDLNDRTELATLDDAGLSPAARRVSPADSNEYQSEVSEQIVSVKNIVALIVDLEDAGLWTAERGPSSIMLEMFPEQWDLPSGRLNETVVQRDGSVSCRFWRKMYGIPGGFGGVRAIREDGRWSLVP